MNLASPDPEPLEDADVGERLRALRSSYGLSQRELARRAGVPNSTISMIEKGRVSPSIASLKKVAAGLSLSLAEFFTAPASAERAVFFGRDELRELGDAKVSLRAVGPARSEAQLQVLHERYLPGGDTGEEMLSHVGEESGVVVRGSIEVTVGGQRRVLVAGDAYQFDSRLPHRFRNVSDEVCEIVSACTPPTF